MKIEIMTRDGYFGGGLTKYAKVNSLKDLANVFDGELLNYDPMNHQYTIKLSDRHGIVTLIGYSFYFEPKEEK